MANTVHGEATVNVLNPVVVEFKKEIVNVTILPQLMVENLAVDHQQNREVATQTSVQVNSVHIFSAFLYFK